MSSGLRFESEKEEDVWLQVIVAGLSGAKTFADKQLTQIADQVILGARERQPVERKPYAKPFPKFGAKPTADKSVVESTDTK